MGTLYVVATPIGNLEDVTLRALRVLREVAIVAAEDTRTAGTLLRHYEVSTPLTSYHDFSGTGKGRRLIERLEGGEDIALISDAGMPGISDPGFSLIRDALAAGSDVTCIPGPSAVPTALVLSGLPSHAFHYVGFLPRKGGERRRLLGALAAEADTVICFESPHRLLATLLDLMDTFGSQRPMAAARELTKRFEEVLRGTIADVLEHFQRVAPRGEFTLVLGGATLRSVPLVDDNSSSALGASLATERQSKRKRARRTES